MPRSLDDEAQRKDLKLRQYVYEQIRRAIITCQLQPGEQLIEGVFAQQFNVSKTPVREALTSLVQNHLVTYVPNRGFTVSQIALRDIQEIFEARLLYETMLFSLALKNITEEELRHLEEVNSQEFYMTDLESAVRCLEANAEFHMIIANASRNTRLVHHYQDILDEAQRLIFMDLQKNILPYSSKIGHVELVEALKYRDEKAGKKAIDDMLASGKKRILGLEEYA
jgi:DNA-binding GntR family transcriptional regulator